MPNQQQIRASDFLSIQHTKYLRTFLAARLHKKPKTIHTLFNVGCYRFLARLANGYLGLLALHLVTFPKTRVDNLAVGDILWLPEESGNLLELMKVIEVSPQGLLNYYTLVCLDRITKDRYETIIKRTKT